MRVVFAGTPAVALPALAALAEAGHEIVAVLTRPSAAQGRSARLIPSPVAVWAAERAIPVLSPATPRDPALGAQLAELRPDACPVVAYGGLIPSELLSLATWGWINLHFSLLPAYRGAAPVYHAIRDGAPSTGVTCFRLVETLDAGPIWRQQAMTIPTDATTGDLLEQLAAVGAAVLVDALAAAAAGEEPRPQPSTGVSLAPKVELADVQLDWSAAAVELERLIRAAWPEPGAWTVVAGKRLRLAGAHISPVTLEPGQIRLDKQRVLIGTGTQALALTQVVPEGKRLMAAADWGRGLRSFEALVAQSPSGRYG